LAYRLLQHAADLALDLSAPEPAGIYASGCAALTDCLTSRATVEERTSRVFRLKAADSELLLVDWLQALLAAYATEKLLFYRALVRLRPAGSAMGLDAEAFGEHYDPARHQARVPVKAVTYHDLRIWEEEEGWRARVVLDI
jgi:SHS2 domain-containing protein